MDPSLWVRGMQKMQSSMQFSRTVGRAPEARKAHGEKTLDSIAIFVLAAFLLNWVYIRAVVPGSSG